MPTRGVGRGAKAEDAPNAERQEMDAGARVAYSKGSDLAPLPDDHGHNLKSHELKRKGMAELMDGNR